MAIDESTIKDQVVALVQSPAEPPFEDFLPRFEARRKHRRGRTAMRVAGSVGAAAILTLFLVTQLPDRQSDPAVSEPPSAGNLLTTFDVGTNIETIEAHGETLYVASQEGGLHVVRQMPGGQVDMKNWKYGYIYTVRATEDALYATGEDGEVLKIDPVSGERLRKLDGTARTLAVDGHVVWRDTGDGYVTRLDADTLEATGTVRAALDADDREERTETDLAAGYGAAWVGDGHTGDLVRVDARSLEVERISLGPGSTKPGVVKAYIHAVATGGGHVWACCDERGRIAVVRGRDGEVVAKVGRRMGGSDMTMAFGDDALWLGTFRRGMAIYRIDAETFELAGPFYPRRRFDVLVARSSGLSLQSGQPGSEIMNIDYDDVVKLTTIPPDGKGGLSPWWLLVLLGGAVLVAIYTRWVNNAPPRT